MTRQELGAAPTNPQDTATKTYVDTSKAPFTLVSVTDLNAAPLGYCLAQSGSTNHPITNRTTTVMVTSLPYSGFQYPYVFQTAVAEDNSETWGRYEYNGVWSAWTKPLPKIVASTSSPISPAVGDLWVDTN